MRPLMILSLLALFACDGGDGTSDKDATTDAADADADADADSDSDADADADSDSDSDTNAIDDDIFDAKAGTVCDYEYAEGADDGLISCFGDCIPNDWAGDGYCDMEMFCGANDFDGDDCGAPGTPGEDCDFEQPDTGYYPDTGVGVPEGTVAGIYLCTGFCYSKSEVTEYTGDGNCDAPMLSCAAFDDDGGDCVKGTPGEECSLDNGSETLTGHFACDGFCQIYGGYDGLGDGLCDEEFDCAEADNDGGDCTPGTPAEACTITEDGETLEGLRDCNGLCLYADWKGDDVCDDDFNCEALDYDDGDCDGDVPVEPPQPL